MFNSGKRLYHQDLYKTSSVRFPGMTMCEKPRKKKRIFSNPGGNHWLSVRLKAHLDLGGVRFHQFVETSVCIFG